MKPIASATISTAYFYCNTSTTTTYNKDMYYDTDAVTLRSKRFFNDTEKTYSNFICLWSAIRLVNGSDIDRSDNFCWWFFPFKCSKYTTSGYTGLDIKCAAHSYYKTSLKLYATQNLYSDLVPFLCY